MANQVTVSEEAKKKAVKTTAILKVCPFSHFIENCICVKEQCQIWDVKRGRCQIENLGEILWCVGGGA